MENRNKNQAVYLIQRQKPVEYICSIDTRPSIRWINDVKPLKRGKL